MTPIFRLINKYAILIAFSIILTTTWFYIKGIIFASSSIEDINSIWNYLHTIVSYVFKLIVAILLWVDTKKFGINYFLIPIAGFIYPLMGVSVFLILYVYKTTAAGENSV